MQGLTGSPEGIAQLSGRAAALLPPLLRLVGSPAPAARAALASLVNLAQEPRVQGALLEAGAVGRCMDYLRERSCAHPHLLVMLLANLTAAEEGAAALLQLGRGPAEGLWVASLLKLFLTPLAAARGLAFADPAAAATDPDAEDPFGHVATILPNVTRLAAGRRLLLQPGRGLLAALASQLRSGSERRRRGCAGAIKNCCFSAEEDDTVEHIAAEEQARRGGGWQLRLPPGPGRPWCFCPRVTTGRAAALQPPSARPIHPHVAPSPPFRAPACRRWPACWMRCAA